MSISHGSTQTSRLYTIGRFGAASAVAVLVVGVNVFANIVSTDGMMISSLSWYLIVAIIPAITADIILNN